MPKLDEILPGLHRWTALVADWTPAQGGAEGWAQEVACVAYEGAGAMVLIDPLVEEDDWAEIDALVERHGGPVALVTTCPWHARVGGEALRRYGNSPGASSYAHEAAMRTDRRLPFQVTHPVTEDQARLPGGLTALLADSAQGEIVLWIEDIATVVAGDVLIGAEGERTEALRVCPQAWLDDKNTVEDVKRALRPLLDCKSDAVVPLHGAPVVENAGDALKRALSSTRST